MSDAWGIDSNADSDLDNHNNGPKALRDAYEAMKKQNDELKNGLASIQNELRSQKVSAVFDSLGIPGAASLYQGEPDPEKAKAWAESMRGVFGGGSPGGTTPPADSTPAPALEAGQQEQLQRMTEAGQHGTPVGNIDAAFAAVGDATDVNGLIAAFQQSVRNGA